MCHAMSVLHDLALELGVSERTLRRAAADGAIRAERPSAHRLRISHEEREWVLGHWPTVAGLRTVLRTEPSVRLALLFGSAARGREHRRSDLDVLVELDNPSPARLAALEGRLTEAAGRGVQLVSAPDAEASPGLLSDVLRDGRVLVDRDGLWRRLKRRAPQLAEAAKRHDQDLLAEALEPLEAAK